MKSYQDFDLSIEKAGGRYRARVLSSPDGPASSEFDLPFSDLELENFVLRFGQTRRTMRNLGAAGDTASRSLREFGGRLYSAIFNGPVSDRLHGSLGIVGQQENTGLRLRLRLSEAPELIDVPWEYLFDASAGPLPEPVGGHPPGALSRPSRPGESTSTAAAPCASWP